MKKPCNNHEWQDMDYTTTNGDSAQEICIHCGAVRPLNFMIEMEVNDVEESG